MRIDDLMLLGTRPLHAQAHRRALDEAELIAIERGRPTLHDDVRSTAGAWLLHRFNEADANPATVGVFWTARDATRATDRVRIATSLAEALLAIALWDQLDEDTRNGLLGPWARFITHGGSDGAG